MDVTSLTSSSAPFPPALSGDTETLSRGDEDLFVDGRGSWLTDSGGRRFLDFVQSNGVNCLGHCSPVVKGALLYQSSRLISCDTTLGSAPTKRLAEELKSHSGLAQVTVVRDGEEAYRLVARIAQTWNARTKAEAGKIIRVGGRGLSNSIGESIFVPLGDPDSLVAAVTDDVAAVIVAPVQPDQPKPISIKHLQWLRWFTTSRNVLLIVDETQCGVGRTGALLAYAMAGIRPDIVILGRGLGGGLPLAAVLATSDLVNDTDPVTPATDAGMPLMAAVGCAVLAKVTRRSFLRAIEERSIQLTAGLRQIAEAYGLGDLSGRGLFLGLGVPRGNAQDVVRCARQRGLLLTAPCADRLLLTPALTVTAIEIERALAILMEAVAKSTRFA